MNNIIAQRILHRWLLHLVSSPSPLASARVPKLLGGLLACLLVPSLYAAEPPTEQDHADCKERMAKVSQAIQAFKAANGGKLPNLLSDLHPQFLAETNLLVCPYTVRTGVKKSGIPDARVKTAYHYEFGPGKIPKIVQGFFGESDLTMAEWKTLQMKLVGDEVPMVRCFNHPKSLNLTVGGALKESRDIWEADYLTPERPMEAFRPDELLKKFGKVEAATKAKPAQKPKQDSLDPKK